MDQQAMSSTSEAGPNAKKLKTLHAVDTTSFTPSWAHLPYLVMVEVFRFLTEKEIINVSGVCRIWRENYFHPRFSDVTFSIQNNDIEKARFITNTFGLTVTHAKVVLGSYGECVREFINLLQKLSNNKNLKSLDIKLSEENLQKMCSYQSRARSDYLAKVMGLLTTILPRLTKLNISCINELSLCVKTLLKNLNPSLVTSLGLTALLDDPASYVSNFEGTLQNITKIRMGDEGLLLFESLTRRLTKVHILLKVGTCHIDVQSEEIVVDDLFM